MKKFLCGLLAAISCFALAACAPSSVEKAETKMQEAGYKVVAYSKEAEGSVGGFVATKGLTDLTNGMTAVLFSTKEEAAEFYSTVSELDGATQDGKWVYWGSEEAVKAFTALF